jgi:integrase
MSTTEYINVSRSLENLEQEVSEPNAAAVRDLINHSAAEGVGKSQQQRYIYAFKTLLKKFTSDDFRLRGASEKELKDVVANVNRSDYAEATKHKFRCALKKFYKIENGGTHPEKVDFFSVHKSNKPTSVTRDDLFTEDELKQLLKNFTNTRDRAFTYVLYESAARPGELFDCTIADVTSNGKGDFIFLEGAKGTPDRTNQLVRSGRVLHEWIAQHPLGGEFGDIEDPSAPLWVKTEQQACKHCSDIPTFHSDSCTYESNPADPLKDAAFRRRFKDACERAGIPENKRRPYNLRHTRLTEVATFMGYEQLNKFAGWKPGSDRAKVYVHLNNDDVNQAIREEYGLDSGSEEEQSIQCSFCGTENESQYSECRNCGRPLSLKKQGEKQEKQQILDRLSELDEKGVLEKLEQLESLNTGQSNPALNRD